jgi:pimeloyl-ACP methyl ester carboxylesterase
MKLEIISKYPVERQHPTPLLFIHGMLHAAWCWDVHFLDYFAQHGYAAFAVNLRGHGCLRRHPLGFCRPLSELPAGVRLSLPK